jgi:hypothetical protein
MGNLFLVSIKCTLARGGKMEIRDVVRFRVRRRLRWQ